MGKLDGRNAIVFGSSRGIGKGIARYYAREGARVAVIARTETPGKLAGTIGETVDEIRAAGGVAIGVRCDITDEADVEAMVGTVLGEFGSVDIMVNSAAVILFDKIIDTTFKRWDLLYRVNVHGAFLVTKAVLPHMIERRRGSIIQLTSRAATNITPGGTHYGSTKSALERLCVGLAAEVKEYNIAVNCLDPGGVKTEGAVFTRPRDFDWAGWVEPIEVGPVAAHMAVQDAKSMTGQVIRRPEYRGK